MSHATVVSVCNFEIGPEHKPQLSPSHYSIPAAKPKSIAVLSFEDPVQYIPTLDYKTIVVPVPALEVARSIVYDWIQGQLKVEDGAEPGLFYLSGEYEIDDVMSEYSDKVEIAFEKHTLWAQKLVEMGDDLWQAFRKHRHISKSMMDAASFLGEEREWSKIRKFKDFINCPACKSLIDSDAIVCKVCTIIVNPARFAELNLQKVG